MKKDLPNGYLPVLIENGKEAKDQGKACMRYVCQRFGMYPKDPMEVYRAECVVEVVSEDCKFFDPSFVEAEDKMKWGIDFSAKKLPGYFANLDKICSENIKKTGFAANNSFSIADVALLSYLSYTAFHPTRHKQCSEYLAKFPTLMEYWKKH
jgi:glutathione S-transferase